MIFYPYRLYQIFNAGRRIDLSVSRILFCLDVRLGFSCPGDNDVTVEPDLSILEVVKIPDGFFFIMDTSVKRIEHYYRRNVFSRVVSFRRHRSKVYFGYSVSDQYSFRYLFPVPAAYQFIPACEFLYLRALLHSIFRIQIDKMQHYLCDFGIELHAGPLNDLFTHYLLRHCIAVAPVGRHGIIRIRHSDYP